MAGDVVARRLRATGRLSIAALSIAMAAVAQDGSGAAWGQAPDSGTDQHSPGGMRVIAEGFLFPEGPAIAPNGDLYFSDSPGKRIFRWDGESPHLFTVGTERSNGLAMDPRGNVYACAGQGHKVLKFDPGGRESVFVDSVDGQPLNNPNDVVMDRRGNLYFTNPRGRAPNVVFAEPDGSVRVVAADPAGPNGIALSPDERTLYVGDYRGDSIWAYTLASPGHPTEARVIATFPGGGPDGIAVAQNGNVYVVLHKAAKVVVLRPDGAPSWEVLFPEGTGPTNLCFGGSDLKTLYVTVAGAPVSQMRSAFAEDGKPYGERVRRLAEMGLTGKIYAVSVSDSGLMPSALRAR